MRHSLPIAAFAALLMPAPAAAQFSLDPGVQYVNAAPGKTTMVTATVRMPSAKDRLRLDLHDIAQTRHGAFTLTQTRPGAPSSWVRLPAQHRAPGGTSTVTFSVTPPADATPGDHPIAVRFIRVPRGNGQVKALQAIAMRLNVRIPGALAPNVAVKLDDLPGGIRKTSVARATIKNTGNTVLQLRGTDRAELTVAGRTVTPKATVLYPGQQLELTGRTTAAVPFEDTAATVTARAAGSSVTSSRHAVLIRPEAALVTGGLLVLPFLVLGGLAARRRRLAIQEI